MKTVDLSLFTYKAPVEVRYADIDMMHHVNNAKYLTYIEHARGHYFVDACGWNWKEQGMVLAKNDIDYYLPIMLGDRPEIHIRTVRVGRSSFTQENVIVDHKNPEKVYARAITVLVHVDYANHKPAPIPQDIKDKLHAYDGAEIG